MKFVVHLTYKNGNQQTIETTRVTYLSETQTLAFGTLPNLDRVITINSLQLFWVEGE